MNHVFRKTERAVGNMHFFELCLTDVVNKQLFSPLSWNNPLSKTALGESYILMINRHLEAKKKHSLDVEGVYYFSPFLSPTWLPHGRLWATVEETALLTWCYSLRLILIWPKGHRKRRNKVGSSSLAKHLVEFESASFWISK